MIAQTNVEKIYLLEEDRLKSYPSWPFKDDKPCNIHKMAEAGFYWCGSKTELDSVSCFVCLTVLDGWVEQDDPWFEHQRVSPQCLFVKYGKPEAELTCEQIIDLIEATLKVRLRSTYTNLKDKLSNHIDKKRKQLEKQLRKP